MKKSKRLRAIVAVFLSLGSSAGFPAQLVFAESKEVAQQSKIENLESSPQNKAQTTRETSSESKLEILPKPRMTYEIGKVSSTTFNPLESIIVKNAKGEVKNDPLVDYSFLNSLGNKTVSVRYYDDHSERILSIPVTIYDATAPTLTLKKMTTTLGRALMPNQFVSDYHDNDPSSQGRFSFDSSVAWDRLGTQVVKIKAEDNTGHSVIKETELTILADQVSADPKQGSTSLGVDYSMIDWKNYVQNVKLNGQALAEADYNVKLNTPISTTTIGKKQLDLRVELKSDPSKFVNLKGEIDIDWGNSIRLDGLINQGSPYDDRSAVVMSLQKSGLIVATHGTEIDNLKIHDYYINQKYYSFDWFNLANTSELNLSGKENGDQHLQANGTDLKQDALQKWRPQKTTIGDLVKVWMVEKKRLSYYLQGNQTKGTNETEYFETTANGFSKLYFNQLPLTKQVINFGTSTAELDKKIADFLDTSQFGSVSIQKFITYPDTNKTGDSEGVIRVAESTKSGKKITYDYKVPFSIKQITAEPVETTFLLGADSAATDLKKLVKNVKMNGQLLTEQEFDITQTSGGDLGISGDKVVGLRLSLKSDPTIFKDIDVKVKVLLGNTLLVKTNDFADTAIALSIVDENGQPRIRATKGTGFKKEYPRVLARPVWNLYSGDLSNTIETFSYWTVNQSSVQLMDRWNKQINALTNKVRYGDAISLTVSYYDVESRNYNGENTWVARNENLVCETKGYKHAFYEISKNGLLLLHANQLTPQKQSIEFGTTKEQMDQNVSSYLDTKSFSNIKVKKFLKYPDTAKEGETVGIIQVEETSSSGRMHTYNYEVPFNVSPAKELVDISIPTKFLFGSLDIQNGAVFSPKYHIKNLGKKTTIVHLNSAKIDQNSFGIDLLTESESDPTDKKDSLRLNLHSGDFIQDQPIYEGAINKELIQLQPNTLVEFELNGKFFGTYEKEKNLNLALTFQFEIKP